MIIQVQGRHRMPNENDSSSVDQIQQINAELQQIVAERTHELVALNRALQQEINQRKKTEGALRESEERYRAIFENTGTATFLFEADTMISLVNAEFEKLSNYYRTEIEGKMSWTEIVFEDDLERLLGYHRQRSSHEGNAPQNYEFRFKDKQGHLKDVFVTIDVIPATKQRVASLLNITERKKIEKELRESEEKFRVIIETMNAGIIMMEAEGKILFTNRHMASMLGYSYEEFAGTNYLDYIHPSERGSGLTNLRSLSCGDTEYLSTQRHYLRKDGHDLWGYVSARRLVTADGKSQVVNVISDMSELKQAEREKKILENHLRQAHKMEAIGTLAGGIAHDFNNILTAVIGYAEMIRYKTSDTAILPFIEQVLKASNRASDLVQQILTFTRQKEQQNKPILVTPIVKEALKLLRSSLPATIEIRQIYENYKDTILADPTQIHQVLMNLCANSAHAMQDQSGVLTVRLSQEDFSVNPRGIHTELKNDSYLKIIVTDTGHGIDPSIIDKIFDPFFTTKQAGQGTGLGLSVVYGIVRNIGGTISCTSKPGKGTIFTLYIPLSDADESIEMEMIESIPGGNERILFVDDEEIIVSLGREMLSSLGYDVTARSSSLDALTDFRANPDQFDLVITDMTMPNMTGVMLTKEILKTRPPMPIILTTGFSELINEEKAKEIGIKALLMKPISIQDLSQTLRRVLDEPDSVK
jgi:PAS domain S-box-containing protein